MFAAGRAVRRRRAIAQRAAAALRRWGLRPAALWRAVRALAGEDAYDRYLEHSAAHHPGAPLLTRRDFWREAEKAKWSGVSRCC